MSPSERIMRSRIAAHTLHAHVDPVVHTEPARQAFLSRFDREADPAGVLSDEERARRAAHLRKAYFARLALASAKARKRASSVNTASRRAVPSSRHDTRAAS
jgi:hypothetical protein